MWIILAGLMLGQAVFVVSEYWLATWARQSYQNQREAKWIWVYGLLVAVIIVIAFVRSLLFFNFTFKASSAMHDGVVEHVLRAPLAFFHTNPTGRILNRFSKDQGTADDHLPQVAFDATQSLFLVVGKFTCHLHALSHHIIVQQSCRASVTLSICARNQFVLQSCIHSMHLCICYCCHAF